MVGISTLTALNSSNSDSSQFCDFVSSNLVEFVKSYEGFSHTPYYDSSNVLTIGYGSTSGWIMSYSYVTYEQARQALMEEINSMASIIKANLDSKGISLKQQEFDALTSFAYNCG